MNFEYLNKMIKYIEDNLENEIDLSELSKIANTNLFILERIFVFLTNMTINEYIKKRRLSKAFEELRNTDQKIIDIAFKYQFNSAPSFNRAFKRVFNINPTECRKKIGKFKIIPIEYFETNKKKYNFDYEIKEVDNTYIYCYHVFAKNHSELLYEIKKLYKDVKNTSIYNEFNKEGMYGIFLKERGMYHYYLGSKKYFPNLETFEIIKNQYAVFKLPSREQNAIVDMEEKINNLWIPSTSYNIKNNMKIELYKDNDCYIYLPIK